MAEKSKLNEDKTQVIQELRNIQINSQNELLKKIIALIAWAFVAAMFITLFILTDLGGRSFLGSLFISGLTGLGVYVLLFIVYLFFLKE